MCALVNLLGSLSSLLNEAIDSHPCTMYESTPEGAGLATVQVPRIVA